MAEKKLTAEELYAEGEGHRALTPARAAELMSIIADVSAKRGEGRPPRLDWLRRVAEGAKPTK